MKQKFLAGVTVLGLVSGAIGQPSQIWENWGQVSTAPQIDALTFINHQGATFVIDTSDLFETADTLNYTNQGFMSGFPGFNLQTFPTAVGQPTMASSFANLAGGINNGVIDVNGTFSFILAPGLLFGNLTGNSRFLIRATNIVNNGTINMSASSLLKMDGQNIDLSRGEMSMVNPTTSIVFGTNVLFGRTFNAGILDGYWAADTATNAMVPSALLNDITPFHTVTNRQYLVFNTIVFAPNAVVYVNDSGTVNSNRFVQVVFLSNLDPSFVNSVYFTPAEIAVQWQWASPVWPTHSLQTNFMYLTDNFGEVTNIGVVLNGDINPQSAYPIPTYRPMNYNFVTGTPYNTNLAPAVAGLLPNLFGNTSLTNQYAAYEGIFIPGTELATDVAGGNATNMAGRIEITADNTLKLNSSRISSLNYLLLRATNHFRGSPNAIISSPTTDLYLRTTNGVLNVTNILVPFLTHPSGTCDLWSGRWTNVVNSITNGYHVLFVDSLLRPTSQALVQTLNLAVTNFSGAPNNLVINDVLNVTTNLLLNAERVTLATNDPSAFNPNGALNILNDNILWSTATPGLQYLTNWGDIMTFNAAYFGGSRTQPPYNTNTVDIPYQAFVNHGGVTNQGVLIWANYFENSGVFEDFQGSIVLQQSQTAVLSGGAFDAFNGQVSINSDNLSVSNYSIFAGGSIDLTVSGAMTDGGPFNGNQWFAGNGFSLHQKPATGDLLGTIVFSSAPDFAETLNYWAGEDRGASPSGYLNNGAVGQLMLFGGTNSAFHFIATGAQNALYVDVLTLSGSAINRDAAGNFPNLDIDPNMTVYFADALVNGQSIAEKLNGKNGGRLVWVSSYAGAYSSTNITYPSGITYTFNRALVQSCTIDSNGNGIPNCIDPAPIPVPGQLNLSVMATNSPRANVLTWQTLANSTNYVFYKTSLAGANWQLLTNFVFGPIAGKATVLDATAASSRYYRVRIEGKQP
ncbi:MAG TPA: hypothetical protein VG146_00930 [Verrucomicrobiae bacterium]|nr:hypothetical protein [Verrucomicrobiae bacterium]